MSSIPPNIIGSLFQSQVSAAENAKETDAHRNKRLRDSRELARLADHQTHEVEDADQAESLYVHREDDEQRDGADAQDTWEHHHQSDTEESARPSDELSESPAPDSPIPPNFPDDDSSANPHIDLSA